jgi:hypothetical protein
MLLLSGRAEPATVVYSGESCPRTAPATRSEDALLGCHLPVFAIEDGERSYNRIGRPEAEATRTGVSIRVDPDHHAVYVDTRHDRIGSREVVHLLYRVHFTKLAFKPRMFFAMHRNPGLMAIVTIDRDTREPLMLTTVHTCGCYRGMVPTDRFPPSALPPAWRFDRQKLWGKILPGFVPSPLPGFSRLLIRLEPRTHRVIGVQTVTALPEGEQRALDIEPMHRLHALPIVGRDGETTSFFYERGPLEGFVKGAWTPIEGLTLGLLMLDVRLGSDKDYGHPAETGTPFYTMILPWNHDVSRLDRFEPLLRKLGFRVENL